MPIFTYLYLAASLNIFWLCVCRSICVVIRTTAEFSRQLTEQDEVQRTNRHFTSHPQLVAVGHDFDLQQLSSELNSAVDAFNGRGSNFVIDRVKDFTIVTILSPRWLNLHTNPTVNTQKEGHYQCSEQG